MHACVHTTALLRLDCMISCAGSQREMQACGGAFCAPNRLSINGIDGLVCRLTDIVARSRSLYATQGGAQHAVRAGDQQAGVLDRGGGPAACAHRQGEGQGSRQGHKGVILRIELLGGAQGNGV